MKGGMDTKKPCEMCEAVFRGLDWLAKGLAGLPPKASRMARSCVAGMRRTAASAEGGRQCARSRIAASAVVRAELGFGIIYT